LLGQAKGFFAISHFHNDFKIILGFQNAAQPLSKERMVVYEH
jgi:hypothetical protein